MELFVFALCASAYFAIGLILTLIYRFFFSMPEELITPTILGWPVMTIIFFGYLLVTIPSSLIGAMPTFQSIMEKRATDKQLTQTFKSVDTLEETFEAMESEH